MSSDHAAMEKAGLGASGEDGAFAARAIGFLAARLEPRRVARLPQVMGAGHDDLDEGRSFLHELGPWAAPTWPEEAGGLGVTPREATILQEALEGFDAPDLYPFMVGLRLVGPTVLEHGTEAQQARWLPPIRTGEEIWCQMFSEPGAGSDLANVACKAVRDGDGWRISGQKVWSSRAHYSRWGLVLARTDPDRPKHAGLTMFAVDLSRPGVVVRPIVQINGDTHFNEVFLDEVEVPDTDRIGGLGTGWGVAVTTLTHERLAIGNGGASMDVAQVVDLVRRSGRAADPLVRQRAADLIVRLKVAEWSNARFSGARSGQQHPSMGAGAKICMSDTMKAASNLAMDLYGPAALATDGHDPDVIQWQTLFLTGPSLSIRGGTDEVMKNILGERVLGLPPEPRVDKDVPFRAPTSG